MEYACLTLTTDSDWFEEHGGSDWQTNLQGANKYPTCFLQKWWHPIKKPRKHRKITAVNSNLHNDAPKHHEIECAGDELDLDNEKGWNECAGNDFNLDDEFDWITSCSIDIFWFLTISIVEVKNVHFKSLLNLF